MIQMDQVAYLRERKALIEQALAARLPDGEREPRRIHQAMRYATLDGGKRLRPLMVMVAAELGGVAGEEVLDAACAMEFVHTASLILDDLPSMDNALSRRSRPCTHVAFDEATAVLASLALIGNAFELVAANASALEHPERAAPAVTCLAQAIGSAGIIHGQHADLNLSGGSATLEELEQAYGHKAGALFVASMEISASLVDMADHQRAALHTYAMRMGLAFQITDDLLDASGKPEDRGKTTFSTHLGVAGARQKACELAEDAVHALEWFDERAEPLRYIANFVTTRTS